MSASGPSGPLVFDCHLLPDWRQMLIENTVSSDFIYFRQFLRAFSIATYPMCSYLTVNLVVQVHFIKMHGFP